MNYNCLNLTLSKELCGESNEARNDGATRNYIKPKDILGKRTISTLNLFWYDDDCVTVYIHVIERVRRHTLYEERNFEMTYVQVLYSNILFVECISYKVLHTVLFYKMTFEQNNKVF